VRLLYHAATVKERGNEGLIGRAREDHCFGFRRANIFRQYQADLGLLLAARLQSARSSGTTQSTSPSSFQDRGGREPGGVVAATSA